MSFNKILDYFNEKGKYRESWDIIKDAIGLMDKYIKERKRVEEAEKSKNRFGGVKKKTQLEFKQVNNEEVNKHEEIELMNLLINFKSLLKTKVDLNKTNAMKSWFKKTSIL